MHERKVVVGKETITASSIKGLYEREFNFLECDSVFLDKIHALVFSGGEVHVALTEEQLEASHIIANEVKSTNDLVKLFLVLRAFRDNGKQQKLNVYLPYLPYARQDKVHAKGQANSLLWVLNNFMFIDNIIVHVEDVHNQNSISSFPVIRNQYVAHSKLRDKYDYIVAPDKGALDRAYWFASRLNVSQERVLSADKVRDKNTGNIIYYEMPVDIPKDSKVLVVDDICDGGYTFELVRRCLPKEASVDLHITHGIFSKGTSKLASLYNLIYTINDWTA